VTVVYQLHQIAFDSHHSSFSCTFRYSDRYESVRYSVAPFAIPYVLVPVSSSMLCWHSTREAWHSIARPH